MSLEDLISGNYCPITGMEFTQTGKKTGKNKSRKAYQKKWYQDFKEKHGSSYKRMKKIKSA